MRVRSGLHFRHVQRAHPPSITSAANRSVQEGLTFSGTLNADQNVTWSIVGGADAAKFTLSGNVLSMSAKDTTAPADADANNVYQVTVRATAALGGLTVDQAMAVTVTAITAFPTIGSTAYRSWPMIASNDALLASQGSAADWGYTERAVGAWITPMYDRVTGLYFIGVQAYKAPTLSMIQGGDFRGIAKVSYSLNNGPWFDVTAVNAHPLYPGPQVFLCPVRPSLATASGPVEVRAIVYPRSGKPFCMQGRPANGYGSSYTDTTAGPDGYSIDPRTFSYVNGSVYRMLAFIPQSHSMILDIDKGDTSPPTLFIDPVNGNDANTGADNTHAKQTWAGVFDRLEAIRGGPGSDIGGSIVYLCAGLTHKAPGFDTVDGTHVSPVSNLVNCSKLYKARERHVLITPDPAAAAGSVGFSVAPRYPILCEKLTIKGRSNTDRIKTSVGFGNNDNGLNSSNLNYGDLHLENIDADGGSAVYAAGSVYLVDSIGGGSGYTSEPTFTPPGGGTGFQAQVEVVNGAVVAVRVVNPGQGYSTGAGTFSGGGGTGASATAHTGVYVGQPSGPGFMSGGLGHNQALNCSIKRMTNTGFNWATTLVLNIACDTLGSQADIAGFGKYVGFLDVKNTQDDPGGNHLDISQGLFDRGMFILENITTSGNYNGQGLFSDLNAHLYDGCYINCSIDTGTFSHAMEWGSATNNLYALNPIGGGGDPATTPTTHDFGHSRIVLWGSSTGAGNFELNYRNGISLIYPATVAEPIDEPYTSVFDGYAPGKVIELYDASLPGSIILTNRGSSGRVDTRAALIRDLKSPTDFRLQMLDTQTNNQFDRRRPPWSATALNGSGALDMNVTGPDPNNPTFAGDGAPTGQSLYTNNGIASGLVGTSQFEMWFYGDNQNANADNTTAQRMFFDLGNGSQTGAFSLWRDLDTNGGTRRLNVQMGYGATGVGSPTSGVAASTGTLAAGSTFGSFNTGRFFVRIQCLTDRVKMTVFDAAHPTGYDVPDGLVPAGSTKFIQGGQSNGGTQRRVLGANATAGAGSQATFGRFYFGCSVAVQPLSAGEVASFVSEFRTRAGF